MAIIGAALFFNLDDVGSTLQWPLQTEHTSPIAGLCFNKKFLRAQMAHDSPFKPLEHDPLPLQCLQS